MYSNGGDVWVWQAEVELEVSEHLITLEELLATFFSSFFFLPFYVKERRDAKGSVKVYLLWPG